jgi:hypothetical protein
MPSEVRILLSPFPSFILLLTLKLLTSKITVDFTRLGSIIGLTTRQGVLKHGRKSSEGRCQESAGISLFRRQAGRHFPRQDGPRPEKIQKAQIVFDRLSKMPVDSPVGGHFLSPHQNHCESGGFWCGDLFPDGERSDLAAGIFIVRHRVSGHERVDARRGHFRPLQLF